ncbi:MAG: FhaA domain-containing protein, partial [Pontimonas sp.]
HYICGLSSADFDRLTQLGDAFLQEITHALADYAQVRGYGLSGPLTVELSQEDSLSEGMVEVRSTPTGAVVWVPTLIWDSIRYPLIKKSTIIGRGTDTDVHVVARGVSRHHAEVRWDGKRAEVRDLGSTNGTKLDGERVTRAALPDKCSLVIGQARILFEVVPQSEDSYRALAHHTPPSTEETS